MAGAGLQATTARQACLLLLVWLAGGGGAQEQLQELEQELEQEIVRLEEETVAQRRWENYWRFASIFLRVAGTGGLAVSRNMQYAEINGVFQGDDDEEEDGERRRLLKEVLEEGSWGEVEEVAEGRNFVPQFPGEPLFTVPPSYWTQVMGRALYTAGFAGPTTLAVENLELSCGLDTWKSVRSEFSDLFSPGQSGKHRTELQFLLSQFSRSLGRQLGCLTGSSQSLVTDSRLRFLQGQLITVLTDKIGKEAPDGGDLSFLLSDILLESTMEAAYTSATATRGLLASDWLRSSALTLSILLAKLTGFSLVTLGRNLGDWPTEVDLNTVSTAYRLGVLGRSLNYALFTVDDFRTLATYSPPTCDQFSLHSVFSHHSDLLYPGSEGKEALQAQLSLARLQQEAEESVACLTTTPAQFLILESLEAAGEAAVLKDKIMDVIDLTRIRLQNQP